MTVRASVVKSTRVINGHTREIFCITFDGRAIEAIELDMADQWDFLEIAGRQLDNEPWVNTALLACSVISIDGLPLPSGVRSRDEIRRVLRKLGEDGLNALQMAFEESSAPPTIGHEETAAGN